MWGVEYNNGRGEDTFTSSTGILGRHDILINIIHTQIFFVKMIDWGDNTLYGMIGTIIFCNNGLGSLGVNLFI